jgi:hypothetical protein
MRLAGLGQILPHNGKAKPGRGMLADRGSADGWHEGAPAIRQLVRFHMLLMLEE